MPDTTSIQIPLLPAAEGNQQTLSLEPHLYDSLFTATDSSAPALRTSLFTHHELQVHHTYETSLNRQASSGWFLIVILISFMLTTLYLRAKQITPATIFQASVDHRSLERILREENLTHSADLAPIALLMPIPLALVIYYNIMPTGISLWAAIGQYMLLWAGVVSIYFLRNGVLRLLGTAFNNSEAMGLYISSNYFYHIAYTIACMMMAFFVCYTGNAGRHFLIALCVIVGILFLCRLIRGLNLILTLSKTPKLYLFYYLCILEIVPILALIKVAL